jgi:hypothetical protein
MGRKLKKKKKNKKQKKIVFLCNKESIKGNKQGQDIFKPENSCIKLPLSRNSVL